MKRKLLETLTRVCVREVLSQMRLNEAEGTSPIQGTESGEAGDEPKKKEPVSNSKKGVLFVDPKNKAKFIKVRFKPGATVSDIQNTLRDLAQTYMGNKPRVASDTYNLVAATAQNPNSELYLYVGKYDPESEELYLMADKSWKVAKDSSVSASEIPSKKYSDLPDDGFDPMTADAYGFGAKWRSRGYPGEPVPRTSELEDPQGYLQEQLRPIVKKMVNRILDRTR